MRKILSSPVCLFSKLLVSSLILIFFIVPGCKKGESNVSENSLTDITQSNLGNKVLTFLESQKVRTITATNAKVTLSARNGNIDLLKENLDFTSVRTEPLDNRIDLLIIPIKDEVINKKNLDKNSTLTLLLITDKLGKISSGSIVYFQPSDGNKHSSLPQNTFSNMLSGKTGALDGKYKMLTVSGRWISQFGIKNGRLFSAGTVEQKNKEGKSTQKTSTTCVDWYLVTTYYYTDGTTEETREYIGTTCEGDCDNSGEYVSLCRDPNADGGGGGTGDPTQPDDIESGEDEIIKTSMQPVPDLSNGPSASGNMISVTYHAWCGWSYNYTQLRFDYINLGNPYVVPVSQVFADDNGNPATLHVSIVPLSTKKTPLNVKQVYVQWTFDAIWNYSFTTGNKGPFTFVEGIGKVIGPL